jgi:NAD(P)-dependent dehydrogenase (short-subunit alcohol dehydrogenase family)
LSEAQSAPVAVITGAFGVLGQSLVRAALAAGYQVAALDFADAPSAALPTGAEPFGGVDLAEPAMAEAAMAGVVGRFGRIDALFNVAGGFTWETVGDGDPASWHRMHRLNVMTTLNASRAVLASFKTQGAGRIVNVGANGAVKAAMGMGAYAASKAGVHRLTEALAEEFKAEGITVNAVLPSIIDTPTNRTDMPDADFSQWVQPDDLAAVMIFLASPAARGITGALLPVTGKV